MKKALSLITALLFAGLTAIWADPANPDPIKMKQPDGTTITLRIHGDEFHSWYTSEDGKTVYKRDRDGWWKPSSGPGITPVQKQAAKLMRAERDAMFRKRSKEGLGLGFGDNHFLIILVEWSDKPFQPGSKEYFPRMLAGTNFTENGSVGSAKEYYTDGSNGKFTPNFDVYGPITLARKHNEFPDNDVDHHYYMAMKSLQEAVTELDKTVDLSIYDNDKDGYIDNVYMFYPGEAQSNSGGPDTIWPHSWWGEDGVLHDGVKIGSYACSAEQYNSTSLNGIGTFCHEFGHVIGLPDFYDTDYAENGSAKNPNKWMLMASGNHNSNGRIPARLSTMEKIVLGYITEYEDLTTSPGETKTIQSLDAHKAYRIPTPNPGEFFVTEVRNGQKWDQPLPKGMLLYHADQSNNDAHGRTAAYRWENWDGLNAHEVHPCYYPVRPVDDSQHNGYQSWVFPKDNNGLHNITEYAPTAWDGSQPYVLSNITYSGNQASFTVSLGERFVSGTVTEDRYNTAISGATIIVGPRTQQAHGRVVSLAVARKSAIGETKSDSEGKYKITLPDNAPEDLVIYAFATDYMPYDEIISGFSIHKDISLSSVWTGGENVDYTKAGFPISSYGKWGTDETGDGINYTIAVKYTAEELKDLVGCTFKSISYSSRAAGEEIYVIIDFGTTKRVLAKKVDNPSNKVYRNYPANTVDISNEGVVIPANTDIYIGYAIKNSDADNAMATDYGQTYKSGGSCMYYGFSTTEPGGNNWVEPRIDWNWTKTGNALISFSIEKPWAIDPKATLLDMGISYIDLPTGTLTAGTTMPLKLVVSKASKPESVQWYFDGAAVSGSSVTLTSGKHVIKVRYELPTDTVSMQLEARINVQ